MARKGEKDARGQIAATVTAQCCTNCGAFPYFRLRPQCFAAKTVALSSGDFGTSRATRRQRTREVNESRVSGEKGQQSGADHDHPLIVRVSCCLGRDRPMCKARQKWLQDALYDKVRSAAIVIATIHVPLTFTELDAPSVCALSRTAGCSRC